MKVFDIVKKVSKILCYLAVGFAAVFASVTYYETTWTSITTRGSKMAVECKIMVENFEKENKIKSDDPVLAELASLCEGISSQRVAITVHESTEQY